MTASREQARGEGNCTRGTARGMEPAFGWVSAESVRHRRSVTAYSDAFSTNLRSFSLNRPVPTRMTW
jgi:hypothetical protein